MVISQSQADELLKQGVMQYEKGVEQSVVVLFTQEQFDALVSFTYNLGINALKGSTLLRKLNSGDYEGAADEFLKWNKAGGKILSGLTRRREAERMLFLS
ncbi:Lysozyme RrrD [compost metagenome]